MTKRGETLTTIWSVLAISVLWFCIFQLAFAFPSSTPLSSTTHYHVTPSIPKSLQTPPTTPYSPQNDATTASPLDTQPIRFTPARRDHDAYTTTSGAEVSGGTLILAIVIPICVAAAISAPIIVIKIRKHRATRNVTLPAEEDPRNDDNKAEQSENDDIEAQNPKKRPKLPQNDPNDPSPSDPPLNTDYPTKLNEPARLTPVSCIEMHDLTKRSKNDGQTASSPDNRRELSQGTDPDHNQTDLQRDTVLNIAPMLEYSFSESQYETPRGHHSGYPFFNNSTHPSPRQHSPTSLLRSNHPVFHESPSTAKKLPLDPAAPPQTSTTEFPTLSLSQSSKTVFYDLVNDHDQDHDQTPSDQPTLPYQLATHHESVTSSSSSESEDTLADYEDNIKARRGTATQIKHARSHSKQHTTVTTTPGDGLSADSTDSNDHDRRSNSSTNTNGSDHDLSSDFEDSLSQLRYSNHFRPSFYNNFELVSGKGKNSTKGPKNGNKNNDKNDQSGTFLLRNSFHSIEDQNRHSSHVIGHSPLFLKYNNHNNNNHNNNNNNSDDSDELLRQSATISSSFRSSTSHFAPTKRPLRPPSGSITINDAIDENEAIIQTYLQILFNISSDSDTSNESDSNYDSDDDDGRGTFIGLNTLRKVQPPPAGGDNSVEDDCRASFIGSVNQLTGLDGIGVGGNGLVPLTHLNNEQLLRLKSRLLAFQSSAFYSDAPLHSPAQSSQGSQSLYSPSNSQNAQTTPFFSPPHDKIRRSTAPMYRFPPITHTRLDFPYQIANLPSNSTSSTMEVSSAMFPPTSRFHPQNEHCSRFCRWHALSTFYQYQLSPESFAHCIAPIYNHFRTISYIAKQIHQQKVAGINTNISGLLAQPSAHSSNSNPKQPKNAFLNNQHGKALHPHATDSNHLHSPTNSPNGNRRNLASSHLANSSHHSQHSQSFLSKNSKLSSDSSHHQAYNGTAHMNWPSAANSTAGSQQTPLQPPFPLQHPPTPQTPSTASSFHHRRPTTATPASISQTTAASPSNTHVNSSLLASGHSFTSSRTPISKLTGSLITNSISSQHLQRSSKPDKSTTTTATELPQNPHNNQSLPSLPQLHTAPSASSQHPSQMSTSTPKAKYAFYQGDGSSSDGEIAKPSVTTATALSPSVAIAAGADSLDNTTANNNSTEAIPNLTKTPPNNHLLFTPQLKANMSTTDNPNNGKCATPNPTIVYNSSFNRSFANPINQGNRGRPTITYNASFSSHSSNFDGERVPISQSNSLLSQDQSQLNSQNNDHLFRYHDPALLHSRSNITHSSSVNHSEEQDRVVTVPLKDHPMFRDQKDFASNNPNSSLADAQAARPSFQNRLGPDNYHRPSFNNTRTSLALRQSYQARPSVAGGRPSQQFNYRQQYNEKKRRGYSPDSRSQSRAVGKRNSLADSTQFGIPTVVGGEDKSGARNEDAENNKTSNPNHQFQGLNPSVSPTASLRVINSPQNGANQTFLSHDGFNNYQNNFDFGLIPPHHVGLNKQPSNGSNTTTHKQPESVTSTNTNSSGKHTLHSLRKEHQQKHDKKRVFEFNATSNVPNNSSHASATTKQSPNKQDKRYSIHQHSHNEKFSKRDHKQQHQSLQLEILNFQLTMQYLESIDHWDDFDGYCSCDEGHEKDIQVHNSMKVTTGILLAHTTDSSAKVTKSVQGDDDKQDDSLSLQTSTQTSTQIVSNHQTTQTTQTNPFPLTSHSPLHTAISSDQQTVTSIVISTTTSTTTTVTTHNYSNNSHERSRQSVKNGASPQSASHAQLHRNNHNGNVYHKFAIPAPLIFHRGSEHLFYTTTPTYAHQTLSFPQHSPLASNSSNLAASHFNSDHIGSTSSSLLNYTSDQSSHTQLNNHAQGSISFQSTTDPSLLSYDASGYFTPVSTPTNSLLAQNEKKVLQKVQTWKNYTHEIDLLLEKRYQSVESRQHELDEENNSSFNMRREEFMAKFGNNQGDRCDSPAQPSPPTNLAPLAVDEMSDETDFHSIAAWRSIFASSPSTLSPTSNSSKSRLNYQHQSAPMHRPNDIFGHLAEQTDSESPHLYRRHAPFHYKSKSISQNTSKQSQNDPTNRVAPIAESNEVPTLPTSLGLQDDNNNKSNLRQSTQWNKNQYINDDVDRISQIQQSNDRLVEDILLRTSHHKFNTNLMSYKSRSRLHEQPQDPSSDSDGDIAYLTGEKGKNHFSKRNEGRLSRISRHSTRYSAQLVDSARNSANQGRQHGNGHGQDGKRRVAPNAILPAERHYSSTSSDDQDNVVVAPLHVALARVAAQNNSSNPTSPRSVLESKKSSKKDKKIPPTPLSPTVLPARGSNPSHHSNHRQSLNSFDKYLNRSAKNSGKYSPKHSGDVDSAHSGNANSTAHNNNKLSDKIEFVQYDSHSLTRRGSSATIASRDSKDSKAGAGALATSPKSTNSQTNANATTEAPAKPSGGRRGSIFGRIFSKKEDKGDKGDKNDGNQSGTDGNDSATTSMMYRHTSQFGPNSNAKSTPKVVAIAPKLQSFQITNSSFALNNTYNNTNHTFANYGQYQYGNASFAMSTSFAQGSPSFIQNNNSMIYPNSLNQSMSLNKPGLSLSSIVPFLTPQFATFNLTFETFFKFQHYYNTQHVSLMNFLGFFTHFKSKAHSYNLPIAPPSAWPLTLFPPYILAYIHAIQSRKLTQQQSTNSKTPVDPNQLRSTMSSTTSNQHAYTSYNSTGNHMGSQFGNSFAINDSFISHSQAPPPQSSFIKSTSTASISLRSTGQTNHSDLNQSLICAPHSTLSLPQLFHQLSTPNQTQNANAAMSTHLLPALPGRSTCNLYSNTLSLAQSILSSTLCTDPIPYGIFERSDLGSSVNMPSSSYSLTKSSSQLGMHLYDIQSSSQNQHHSSSNNSTFPQTTSNLNPHEVMYRSNSNLGDHGKLPNLANMNLSLLEQPKLQRVSSSDVAATSRAPPCILDDIFNTIASNTNANINLTNNNNNKDKGPQIRIEKEVFYFNPFFEHHLFNYIYPTIPAEYYPNVGTSPPPSQNNAAARQKRPSGLSFFPKDNKFETKLAQSHVNDFIVPDGAPNNGKKPSDRNYSTMDIDYDELDRGRHGGMAQSIEMFHLQQQRQLGDGKQRQQHAHGGEKSAETHGTEESSEHRGSSSQLSFNNPSSSVQNNNVSNSFHNNNHGQNSSRPSEASSQRHSGQTQSINKLSGGSTHFENHGDQFDDQRQITQNTQNSIGDVFPADLPVILHDPYAIDPDLIDIHLIPFDELDKHRVSLQLPNFQSSLEYICILKQFRQRQAFHRSRYHHTLAHQAQHQAQMQQFNGQPIQHFQIATRQRGGSASGPPSLTCQLTQLGPGSFSTVNSNNNTVHTQNPLTASPGSQTSSLQNLNQRQTQGASGLAIHTINSNTPQGSHLSPRKAPKTTFALLTTGDDSTTDLDGPWNGSPVNPSPSAAQNQTTTLLSAPSFQNRKTLQPSTTQVNLASAAAAGGGAGAVTGSTSSKDLSQPNLRVHLTPLKRKSSLGNALVFPTINNNGEVSGDEMNADSNGIHIATAPHSPHNPSKMNVVQVNSVQASPNPSGPYQPISFGSPAFPSTLSQISMATSAQQPPLTPLTPYFASITNAQMYSPLIPQYNPNQSYHMNHIPMVDPNNTFSLFFNIIQMSQQLTAFTSHKNIPTYYSLPQTSTNSTPSLQTIRQNIMIQIQPYQYPSLSAPTPQHLADAQLYNIIFNNPRAKSRYGQVVDVSPLTLYRMLHNVDHINDTGGYSLWHIDRDAPQHQKRPPISPCSTISHPSIQRFANYLHKSHFYQHKLRKEKAVYFPFELRPHQIAFRARNGHLLGFHYEEQNIGKQSAYTTQGLLLAAEYLDHLQKKYGIVSQLSSADGMMVFKGSTANAETSDSDSAAEKAPPPAPTKVPFGRRSSTVGSTSAPSQQKSTTVAGSATQSLSTIAPLADVTQFQYVVESNGVDVALLKDKTISAHRKVKLSRQFRQYKTIKRFIQYDDKNATFRHVQEEQQPVLFSDNEANSPFQQNQRQTSVLNQTFNQSPAIGPKSAPLSTSFDSPLLPGSHPNLNATNPPFMNLGMYRLDDVAETPGEDNDDDEEHHQHHMDPYTMPGHQTQFPPMFNETDEEQSGIITVPSNVHSIYQFPPPLHSMSNLGLVNTVSTLHLSQTGLEPGSQPDLTDFHPIKNNLGDDLDDGRDSFNEQRLGDGEVNMMSDIQRFRKMSQANLRFGDDDD